jgi:hypothetical protein
MYNIIDLASGALLVVVLVVVVAFRGRVTANTKLDSRYFQVRWTRLQKLCSDKKMWYQAIIDADALLDEALKQRHFRGKTTGERLVSAQHYFSSNDALWLSHKLKNKIKDSDLKKPNKKETLRALAAFRLALTDLGALKADRKTKSRP